MRGAATIASERHLEVDGTEPSIRETSWEEHDAGPVETAELQRLDQTDSPSTPAPPTPLLSPSLNLPDRLLRLRRPRACPT